MWSPPVPHAPRPEQRREQTHPPVPSSVTPRFRGVVVDASALAKTRVGVSSRAALGVGANGIDEPAVRQPHHREHARPPQRVLRWIDGGVHFPYDPKRQGASITVVALSRMKFLKHKRLDGDDEARCRGAEKRKRAERRDVRGGSRGNAYDAKRAPRKRVRAREDGGDDAGDELRQRE